MIIPSRSLLYLHAGYRDSKRLVDTDIETPLGYVHSILRGERKLNKFNNWYILNFIKNHTKWRYADRIDLATSIVSIKAMPSSVHRLMYYIDDRPCSFRAMGYKSKHIAT